MKIIIVELTEDSGFSTVVLKSQFKTTWDNGLVDYEISPLIIETLKDQEVWGWLNGKNRFGEEVKRTYMLVEDE